MRKFCAILLLLFLATSSLALDVKTVSESHDLINHEVVLDVANKDITATLKSFDINISHSAFTSIAEPQWHVLQTIEKQEPYSYTTEADCKKTFWDKNQWACENPFYVCQSAFECSQTILGESTVTSYVDEFVPIETLVKKESLLRKVVGMKDDQSFAPGSTRLKVSWKTPVGSWFGSSGEWSVNPASWWNTNWSYRKLVTLDTDTHLSATVTNNHGIVVHIGAADYDFWGDTCTSGEDVRFIDTDDVTQFDHNFEEWLDDTDMYAHVYVTKSFTHDANTSFYIYYGNPACVDDQSESIFVDGHEAVYHLADASTPIVDASDQARSGTEAGNPTYSQAGQISDSVDLDGTGDYFDLSFNNDGDSEQSITMWFNPDSTSSRQWLFGNRHASTNNWTLVMCFNGDTDCDYYVRTPGVTFQADTPNYGQASWQFFAGTFKQNAVGKAYRNAVSDTTDTENITLPATSSDYYLGTYNQGGAANAEELNGLMDEVRIFDYQLSDDEVKLLYHNQNFTTNFVTFGSQEDSSQSPDVNIDYPNGGERFNTSVVSSIDVNFSVEDGDSNSLLVDLNYSTTGSVGTGTAILLDENTSGANIVCDDYDFGDDTTCTYEWDISGVASDTNYYLTIDVNDSVNTANDVSDGNFELYVGGSGSAAATGSHYSELYTNPNSNRRENDENRFFNVTSQLEKTEEEKQTAGVRGIERLLWFGVFILTIAAFWVVIIVWRKR